MSPLPKLTASAINSFNALNRNANASPEEIAQNTRTLNKSIRSLKTKSRKWATIMTLLAVGAVGAAAYMYGGPLPAILKTKGLAAAKIISQSRSVAATSLRKKGKALAALVKAKYGKKNVPLGYWGATKKWVSNKVSRKAPVPLGYWGAAKKRAYNAAGWASVYVKPARKK